MSAGESSGKSEGEATPLRDASLRVDAKTLSGEDQAFAKLMGFGDEGNAPAPAASKRAPRIASASAKPDVAHPAPDATPMAETTPAAGPEPETQSEQVAVVDPIGVPERDVPEQSASDASLRAWEEIHPRAAALGRQSKLLEHAERVLALEEIEAVVPPSPPAVDDAASEVPALRPPARDEPDVRIHALEKQLEQLRAELDAVLVERDRIDDALAIANAARSESAARVERLEAALRAARGPGAALPEGESALRAEVQGLRRRLDEARNEARSLRDALESAATELAIAQAHRDDRQHELDQRREELARLERERADQDERLEDALVRQRELLALVARVQAENVELRGHQAALEETLEARDLEIEAREEHLQVTRRGLAARDAQLRDAEAQLEQERHRRELVETELERAHHTAHTLEERVLRREARIATLSTTLARVEEAIGHKVRAANASEGPATPAALPHTRSAAVADPPAPRPAPPVLSESPSAALPAFEASSRPAVLAGWRDAQVASQAGDPALASSADWFAHAMTDTLARRTADARTAPAGPEARVSAAPLRITSLAGAQIAAEIELVRALESRGWPRPAVRVLAPSEHDAAARRTAVEAAGLAEAIAIELFPGTSRPGESSDAVLFCDVLWSQPSPAALIDRLAATLAPGGIVLFADRLAGGPLTLSETTLAKLGELWEVLPESLTGLPGYASAPAQGDDGGVRALEPAPSALLADRFAPIAELGLGHLSDLMLGDLRGAALVPGDPIAENLLTSIRALDESRTLLESLPPRHGLALFRRHARNEADS